MTDSAASEVTAPIYERLYTAKQVTFEKLSFKLCTYLKSTLSFYLSLCLQTSTTFTVTIYTHEIYTKGTIFHLHFKLLNKYQVLTYIYRTEYYVVKYTIETKYHFLLKKKM